MFVEFFYLIPRLAHPEKFGGKKEDGFDIIVPSLPGFGFSNSIKSPIGPRKIAKIMNDLMIKKLKYKKYIAQGGDWGATISNWLAYDHSKNCKAIHINCLTMRHPEGPKTKAENDFTSFRAVSCQSDSPIRTIHELEIGRIEDWFVITVRANGFLHHMVRNIAGVLIAVGIGKESIKWVADVLGAKDRTLAGVSAEPDGLYLVNVEYPKHYLIPKPKKLIDNFKFN